MKCFNCDSIMEYDNTEGVGYSETHIYICLNCEYELHMCENGEIYHI